MDLLIRFIIALGIFAIVWWIITALGLPRPLMIVIEVLVAIVAIVFLFGLL